jgi:Tfp pilus assembly protein PilX
MKPFRNALSVRTPADAQRGMTLVIVLVMLVLLTLFALNAIRTSTVGLRVVGNQQTQRQMEAAAQNAIEQVISTPSSFGATASAKTIAVNGFSVSVAKPACLYATTAAGFSAAISTAAVTPEDDTFEVVASVSDPVTGAQATVHQSVRMRVLAGTCA